MRAAWTSSWPSVRPGRPSPSTPAWRRSPSGRRKRGRRTPVRHLPSTQLLLGRPTMAGVVVHVKDAQLRHAYALSDIVALRIRSLLSPPAVDAHGLRDVVVRLGFAAGQPITLEKLQVVSTEAAPWITRAEANLC